jgi:hypothetical protein
MTPDLMAELYSLLKQKFLICFLDVRYLSCQFHSGSIQVVLTPDLMAELRSLLEQKILILKKKRTEDPFLPFLDVS